MVPATEIGSISKHMKIFGVGPLGLLIGLMALFLSWLLDSMLGHIALFQQPGLPRILGLVLIGIWICWHAWCIRTIKKWWRGNQLCTQALSICAAPHIFRGDAAWVSGSVLLFNSWIVLLSPFLQYAAYWFLVGREEKMMLTVFGEEYKRYESNTGRLFPRIF